MRRHVLVALLVPVVLLDEMPAREKEGGRERGHTRTTSVFCQKYALFFMIFLSNGFDNMRPHFRHRMCAYV